MKRFPLLLVAFALRASAQSANQVTAPAVLKGVGGFFALSVRDLDASTSWYTEKLGLHVAWRTPAGAKPSVAVLAGGGLVVELVHNDDAPRHARNSVDEPGIFKAGLLVDSLDAAVARLRSRGVAIAFGPFPAKPEALANVIIRDNAGNLIQLLER